MDHPHLTPQNTLIKQTMDHDNCGIGLVAQIEPSHTILEDALTILKNLKHRGACGADEETGDGAGILFQMPYELFQKKCAEINRVLPPLKHFAVATIFVENSESIKGNLETFLEIQRFKIVGIFKVAVNDQVIGKIARSLMPEIYQVVIADHLETELKDKDLFFLRKNLQKSFNETFLEKVKITHLSHKTILYKGMLKAEQLRGFYSDLTNLSTKSQFAIVHSRFSTNTFPSWYLAQPFRVIAHNGEINTIKGNRINFKEKIGSLNLPFELLENNASDSLSLDNVVEYLIHNGYSLAETLMMLIPQDYEQNANLSQKIKDFYHFNSFLMEPWDGPAAILFTNGDEIGAALDRNGLRPSRFIVTKDKKFILSSDVGVLPINEADVIHKGRLGPGQMVLINVKEQKIYFNDEIKNLVASNFDYHQWLKRNVIEIGRLSSSLKNEQKFEVTEYHKNYFYLTKEVMEKIVTPMFETAEAGIFSMGDDTPLAMFSKENVIISKFFKQKFSQVTNPAIDAIREKMVMSLSTHLGGKDFLHSSKFHESLKVELKSPILREDEFEKLFEHGVLTLFEIDLTLDAHTFQESFINNWLQNLYEKISHQLDTVGKTTFIFQDYHVSKERITLPSVIVTSFIHNQLVKNGKRHLCDLVFAVADMFDVHQFALMIGYGADAIYPYFINAITKDSLAKVNYYKALNSGLLKVLSKMGISTLRSYQGAQNFEIIGLSKKLVETYFTGSYSSIGGITFTELIRRHKIHHTEAFTTEWKSGGEFTYKAGSEFHTNNPLAIKYLRKAVRENDTEAFKQYVELADNKNSQLTYIRDLFNLKLATTPLKSSEIEPIQNIMKTFSTGAMSFGSISDKTHETLAIAMNSIGGKSNSGEGGEDSVRYNTNKNSAIKQVASARFGVNIDYLVNCEELQIKIAQGAKPGEGGQLSGNKVTVSIAKIRHSVPGVTLISPPPHHDIYSIEDLAQLIFDLKNANNGVRVSVKLVSRTGIGTISCGVAKAGADVIIIAGCDGGTGASPLSSIKNSGMPWEIGLMEAHQALTLSGLRSLVKIQVDGQLKTARDVVIASILGAEQFSFSTNALISLGCVMARKCHLNTCPVGIATQNPELISKFTGDPKFLVHYFTMLAQDIQKYLATLGKRTLDELVGRVDLITLKEDIVNNSEIYDLDFSEFLIDLNKISNLYRELSIRPEQKVKLSDQLDLKFIAKVDQAILNKKTVNINSKIVNSNRAVGTLLSGHIAKKYTELERKNLNANFYFEGSSGQSFGAFLIKGLNLYLEGEANDYVAKGLSGGKIVIIKSRTSQLEAVSNVIAGNTILYGATAGELYISGKVGERFAVRNSGAVSVVEGVGDHALEYMTNGMVMILGEFGRNLGAGMTGGIAYIYDEFGKFKTGDYEDNFVVEGIGKDQSDCIDLIEKHILYTNSKKAIAIRNEWHKQYQKFIKIIPKEFNQFLIKNSEVKQTSEAHTSLVV